MSTFLSPMINANGKYCIWVDLFSLYTPSGNMWLCQFIGFASWCLCLSLSAVLHTTDTQILYREQTFSNYKNPWFEVIHLGGATFNLPSICFFQFSFDCSKFLHIKYSMGKFNVVPRDLVSTCVSSIISLPNTWENLRL